MNNDSNNFQLNITWLPVDEFTKNINKITEAELTITVNNEIATRFISTWEENKKEIKDCIVFSLYPLAIWFCFNWWRILYEEKRTKNFQNLDFRMSHEMNSAGDGYIWPTISFYSNEENITIISKKFDTPQSFVQYISDFEINIPKSIFKKTIEDFINSVIERLNSFEMIKTDLHIMWNEVQEEINDPKLKKYRIIEAILGFDPDDDNSPDLIIENLMKYFEIKEK